MVAGWLKDEDSLSRQSHRPTRPGSCARDPGRTLRHGWWAEWLQILDTCYLPIL